MTATLISFLWVGGKYKARAQHLFLTCYSNHCDLVQNMPHVELLAAWKGIVMMQSTLRDLQSFGLNIPKEFIVFTIDARTTLLQIRTRSVFYKKKFQALIARIQQSLAEAGLSVFTNLAYIDQKSLPDGSRYHADVLSKTKKQDATEDSILQDYRDLHHMGWIEQVKDFLDKPVDPDILGQVPPQRSATCKLTSTNKNHLAAIHLTATHLIATQLCLVVQRFPQTQVVTVLLLEHLLVHLLAHLLKQ